MDSRAVPRLRPGALIGTFVGLAGAVAGLVLLYKGMRDVMEIGGACAEGGAYEIRQECPDGVPELMMGGIFGGMAFLGIFSASAARLGGNYGRLVLWAWPALFLSLGWNFLEYGLDPPGSDDGPVFGWILSAALFGLMGGVPLLFLLWPSQLRKMLWPREEEVRATAEARPAPRPAAESKLRPTESLQPFTPSAAFSSAYVPAGASAGDMVGRLERLAKLRAEGALDEAEYDRAKRAVLEDGS